MLKIICSVCSAGQISVSAIDCKHVWFTLINCCIGGGDCFSLEGGNK